MLEVVMLLLTYLIKYVFQIKQNLNVSVFNMTIGIDESETLTKNIYHVNVNVSLMKEFKSMVEQG